VVTREEIDSAKQRLTIHELGRMLFPGWQPGSPCRAPDRDDRNPSYSVYDGGRRWKDFGTGEGGDAVSFLAKARGLPMAEALREFVELANGRSSCGPVAPVIRADRSEQPGKPNLSRFREGTPAELRQVAQIRNIDIAAVEMAHAMGTLRFGRVCGIPSWVLTDASGYCAEGRRLDGELYPAITTRRHEFGERKAHTLRHSKKNWTVGILPAQEYRKFDSIAVVEGSPDYLAVLHFMLCQGKSGILPVAMLGRGQCRIDPEALEYFRGKRVRVYPHDDADGGGRRSAILWAQQLEEVGAEVDFFTFSHMRKASGTRAKDLNDCVRIGRHFAYRLEELFTW
jgi:hypothetical protein